MMKKAKNVKDQTEKITTTSKLVGVSFCALLHVCICVSARARVCIYVCTRVQGTNMAGVLPIFLRPRKAKNGGGGRLRR